MPKREKRRDQDGIYERSDSPYYWVSYTDASGKRIRRSTGIRKSAEGRKEAEALLAKWTVEAHQEKHWGEQPDKAFDELMLAYLRGPSAEKRSSERDHFSAKHLYKHFSGRFLRSIGASDIRNYTETRRKEGIKPGTINKEIGLFPPR